MKEPKGKEGEGEFKGDDSCKNPIAATRDSNSEVTRSMAAEGRFKKEEEQQRTSTSVPSSLTCMYSYKQQPTNQHPPISLFISCWRIVDAYKKKKKNNNTHWGCINPLCLAHEPDGFFAFYDPSHGTLLHTETLRTTASQSPFCSCLATAPSQLHPQLPDHHSTGEAIPPAPPCTRQAVHGRGSSHTGYGPSALYPPPPITYFPSISIYSSSTSLS
eukprot:gene11760-8087_t